jgi:transposase
MNDIKKIQSSSNKKKSNTKSKNNRPSQGLRKKTTAGIQPMYNNVAGIDIGSELIHVAIINEQKEYEVREFETLTPDLNQIADWLSSLNIQSAAMEATGVYWIPLFEILQDKSLNPVLVDPKSAKNVPGRKTDVLDCQWIHKLFSCGLLQPAFRPTKEAFRAYMRHRGNLIKLRQKVILQMLKSLLLMNIKLDIAVTEVTSVTGMKIIRAIVNGERDPQKLAALRHQSCKKPEKIFVAALTGNYQKTHLFTLKQSLESYDYFRRQIDECDALILEELQTWSTVAEKAKPSEKVVNVKYALAKKPDQNEFNFDMRTLLHQKIGVDLTAINSLGNITVATIISELGGKEGLLSFKTEKAWCSWLALCPGNNISGGKSLGGQSKKTKNRIKSALCMAAMSLANSKCALGAYYRRMASRVTKSKAIKAVAHKLARLIYKLLTNGHEYVAIGQDRYEKEYHKRRIKNLIKNARELGYELVENTIK